MKNLYLNAEKNAIYIAKYPFDITSKVEQNDIIILICEKEIKINEGKGWAGREVEAGNWENLGLTIGNAP